MPKYRPSEALMINKLQSKAEEVGADGIIMLERGHGSYTNNMGKTYSYTDFRAMAFNYRKAP